MVNHANLRQYCGLQRNLRKHQYLSDYIPYIFVLLSIRQSGECGCFSVPPRTTPFGASAAVAALLSLNVKQDTAKKIAALQAFLGPTWLPLWETHKGHKRLVFLSPHLIQLYRDVQEPFYSSGYFEAEPPYNFAGMMKKRA